MTFLAQSRGQRKALTALAATRVSRGATAAPFVTRLRRQLEGLVRADTRGRSAPSAGAASALRERRDEIHRQALRAIPMTPTWRGGRKQ